MFVSTLMSKSKIKSKSKGKSKSKNFIIVGTL